ncbi:hypothetical protein AMECASPLE_039423 [Ameca splendens]|uniref:Uncharacterized protein n=1 Tax=Ameca splendens TaxID=208324 RepID=A0ABV0YWS4_9TELE
MRHLEDLGLVAGPRTRGVLKGEEVRAIWVPILRTPFMLSESSKAKSGLSGKMREFCAVWVWGEGGISTSPVDFGGETFWDDLSFSTNWPVVSAGAVGGLSLLLMLHVIC